MADSFSIERGSSHQPPILCRNWDVMAAFPVSSGLLYTYVPEHLVVVVQCQRRLHSISLSAASLHVM